MWSAILGIDVTAEQVGLCMIAVKISRMCHAIKHDSLVDIAGYAETISMLVAERQRRQEPLDNYFSQVRAYGDKANG